MASAFVFRCSAALFLRFLVSKSVAILGRSPQCDFVVEEPSVSRRHAEIRVEQHRLRVCDLGSRNGTFVDNLRIQDSRVVKGQVVAFGNVMFSVEI